jgi:transcriptional regulator with XRE-family HTH domain
MALLFYQKGGSYLNLKELCKSRGFTLTEIARQTNTTVDYLSKLNTGRRSNPTWQTIVNIATILKVQPTEVGNSISKERKI